MNSEQHNTNNKPKGEHGTMRSYIRGFLLSLICTFIPYYLVVEQVVSGNAVLVTILSFAVVQMIIQIVFFLHLGREPKPRWNLLFFVSTVGLILVVVGGSVLIMHNLHYNMSPVTASDASKKLVEDEGIYQIAGKETGACQGRHTNHKVVIKDGRVNPVHTAARECDTLTLINEDDGARDMVFGVHPNHVTYAGEAVVTVRKGRAKTITLSEVGTRQFHDILHDQTSGTFTVEPQK